MKIESLYDVSSCLFMKTRSRSIGKRTECDREATQIKKAQTGSNIEHVSRIIQESTQVIFFWCSLLHRSLLVLSVLVISKIILYNTLSDIFVPFYKIKDKSSGENVRSNSKPSFWTNFCNVLRFPKSVDRDSIFWTHNSTSVVK